MGVYLSTDPVITPNDLLLSSANLGPADLPPGGQVSMAFIGTKIPAVAPGTYYVGILMDDLNSVAEADETNNYSSSPIEVLDGLNFETYPNGSAACNGLPSCSVTDEFASRGVVFSAGGDHIPSLCRTTHGPPGEGANYGVTPEADGNCTGWTGSTVTMTFSAPYPKTIQFEMQGPNPALFPVTGFDPSGAQVGVATLTNGGYQDATNNSFARQVKRLTSATGIQSVTIDATSAAYFIDKLIIIPRRRRGAHSSD
jgi:hypothetical protein